MARNIAGKEKDGPGDTVKLQLRMVSYINNMMKFTDILLHFLLTRPTCAQLII